MKKRITLLIVFLLTSSLASVARQGSLKHAQERSQERFQGRIQGRYLKHSQERFQERSQERSQERLEQRIQESSQVRSQDRPVKGVVKDKDGIPLPGVSITLKNSKNGVSTGQNGDYVISVPGNGVLIFSAVGFTTQEVPVNNRIQIDVTLVDDIKGLSEVVVIGYGTAQKKDVTGSISSVKATQLENENPQSVSDILRGNIAGLSVSLNTSAKGGGDLLVRGKTTLSAGTSPLIVLDGVIYNGQLSDINPNDIESVDVLKDASSLAVFGAKAATGVVAITTKKGRSDKPAITFNTNFGFASLAQDMRPYDPQGFLNWRADVMRSGGSTAPYLYNDPRNLPEGVTITQWLNNQNGDPVDLWLNRLGLTANEKANYLAGKTVNWYDEIFRKGIRQDHTLSMGGKKDELTYYMSIGYQDNENLIKGGKFSTFRSRINLEGQAAKFLTVGLNLQYADRNEGAIEADWAQLINLSPYGDMYNADGTLRRIPTDDNGLNARNPFLNMTYNDRFDRQNTLFASLFARTQLPFGITYQLNFSPGIDMYRTFNHSSSKNPNVTTPGGSVTRANEVRYNWQVDNLLKWNKTFNGIHNLDVTLLANAEKYQTWWTQAGNEGFIPGDVLGYHNVASGIKPTVNSEDKVYTGDALMARLGYSFMQRYNLTLSVRRDGYSVFGINSKRANFPAAAIAWTFTEESFLKPVTWLNYGKLRFSYGINGNRDLRNPDNGTVDPYAALTQLTVGKYQTVNGSGAASEVNTVVIGTRMGNPDLRWEQTASFNMGLDFSILNSTISGSVDVYNKKTTDLLVRPTIPNVSGYLNVYSNLARVDNRGLELNLNSRNIQQGNITWNTSLNFFLNRNKIVKLATPADDPGNGWFIGRDIDVIWEYKVLGVWQENETEEANKFNKGIKPGDFKLEDVDGNYVYNDSDKQFLGYTNPRFTWALRNEFNIYKSFDFSFQLLSNWGQYKRFDQAKNQPGSVGFARQTSYVIPYWTAENPINDYARLNSGLSGTSFGTYRKNSFIRLNTVALAYTLPASWISKINIKGAKLYMNVNNAAVYAPDWNYWDPQNDGPTPKYYTLGLNVSL
ncbi:SusC/RagA family TonB-linked outer membrane protein [Pedobacter metabolipauper]|uniref:TonB-linked SusC/RagA family outer membrane protein n=1 Tax=Pedobacter metabolipauper TaxID=425513 RepID=A0A4R6T2K6_9SPHI|nr:SusC/RagA family TonB-linked outer membrane protein [Pedobacter metabolipauper]TDQ11780.1 TonB-linked SusC/RagA family outer membrane protein [Pedobacter metabolipauper]